MVAVQEAMNECPGIAARDRVGNINPCDAGVSMGGSAHEPGRVFDELGESTAHRRSGEGSLKGRPLCTDPVLGKGWDMGDVNDLQVGRRCRGGGGNGNNTSDGEKMSHVFQRTRRFGGSGDASSGDKNSTTYILRVFQNEI